MTPNRLRAGLLAGLLLLLAVSPLPFGSVESGWMLAIQWSVALLALGTLIVTARDPRASPGIPRWTVAGALVLAVVAVVQVLPLPWLSAALAPKIASQARAALTTIEPSAVAAAFPQSVSPPDSMDAALRLGAYAVAACVAAVLFRERSARRRLAWVLAGLGVFEAVYGAAEYLSGHQQIFLYAKKYYLDEATGTFINRNHFAGYLAMTLPFALALAFRLDSSAPVPRSWRERVLRLTRGRGLAVLAASAAAGCIWVGVFLSYSRGGLLAAIVGTAVFALGSARRRGVALKIAATAILPAFALLWFAVRAPGERFLALPAEAEVGVNRLMVAKTSAGLVAAQPWLGYGFGTFESVFRLRKPLADRVVFDHAHDEPLQLAVEGGVVAVAGWIAVVLGLLSTQLPRRQFHREDPTVIAAWAALAAVAAHSLIDFPFRIPGIALLAAVHCGVVLAGSARGDHDLEPVATLSSRVRSRSREQLPVGKTPLEKGTCPEPPFRRESPPGRWLESAAC